MRSSRPNLHPPIIVRFANKDKRNELYSKRKMFKSNSSVKSRFGNAELSFKRI